jgi:hypothetical protein
MTISTRHLTLLPDVDRLRTLLQSMAMLDAILSPDWQYRYYSFNAHWSGGEQMGSMRNGSGDDFFALFNASGCFLKGFAHESLMSPYRKRPKRIWPGLLDSVPAEFAACLKEPAFSIDNVTFCIWRGHANKAWSSGTVEFPDGSDPDGSEQLLAVLDGQPASYKNWAENYYEVPASLTAVQQIYAHESLTEGLIRLVNSDLSLAQLATDANEIGYPVTRAS